MIIGLGDPRVTSELLRPCWDLGNAWSPQKYSVHSLQQMCDKLQYAAAFLYAQVLSVRVCIFPLTYKILRPITLADMAFSKACCTLTTPRVLLKAPAQTPRRQVNWIIKPIRNAANMFPRSFEWYRMMHNQHSILRWCRAQIFPIIRILYAA